MIYNTELIAKCLNLNITTKDVAAQEMACACCGRTIAKGDGMDPFVEKDSFNNHRDLACPSSKHLCKYCAVVHEKSKAFLGSMASCAFTNEGAFRIKSNDSLGWFLRNPPEPPYVMTIQVAKNNHIVWLAPVNLSSKFMLIQQGDSTLKVRFDQLNQAMEATRHLREVEKRVNPPKTEDAAEKYPFLRSPKEEAVGKTVKRAKLAGWILKLLKNNDISEDDIQPLLALSSGEAWALSFALNENAKKPEPLTL